MTMTDVDHMQFFYYHLNNSNLLSLPGQIVRSTTDYIYLFLNTGKIVELDSKWHGAVYEQEKS